MELCANFCLILRHVFADDLLATSVCSNSERDICLLVLVTCAVWLFLVDESITERILCHRIITLCRKEVACVAEKV